MQYDDFKVYEKFSSKGEEFFIAILPENHIDDALDLLTNFCIPEENFCKAIQIHLKPNAMKIMMESYRELFQQNLTLACFTKETLELVGRLRSFFGDVHLKVPIFSNCLNNYFLIVNIHARIKCIGDEENRRGSKSNGKNIF